MAIIEYELRGKTALITMANAENRQDLAFADAMLAALDRAEADKVVKSIVLWSSDEKNWSRAWICSF